MNILRGDIARLGRSVRIITDVSDEMETGWCIRRAKPFKYTYEKEIVLYARFKQLKYFSTECIYSPMAYRGHVREHLKQLEKIRPSVILDIIQSGECFDSRNSIIENKNILNRLKTKGICQRCGYISSQDICKACILLEGLNSGRPRLGVSKTSKIEKTIRISCNDDCNCKNES
ncbi:cytoplasmic tRNA 2-thiolation protein 1-like protein [Euroglyphus maynei]|uniref:Cytoplasmic tRNA 2-thiolation protein 1-like protein n=1 Tax=Euroglyphus maynei TaxID=6958 RepID=A0A1Y3B7N8_EURMA|nr:cytoplasmic tRNA 2-thiolation protein 1-like protein [Euroglyphus maynei]